MFKRYLEEERVSLFDGYYESTDIRSCVSPTTARLPS